MATMLPSELLKLWTREQIPAEMTLGHVVQNLVKLHEEIEVHTSILRKLRADVDRLLAHTKLPPIAQGKAKSSKPDATPDLEQ